MKVETNLGTPIRKTMIEKGDLVEYKGYDIIVSTIMDFPYESCNMVAGVKKYGFDIVNKDGEIVESDHDSSYACLSNCIDNAELLIDGRVDFLKESENV